MKIPDNKADIMEDLDRVCQTTEFLRTCMISILSDDETEYFSEEAICGFQNIVWDIQDKIKAVQQFLRQSKHQIPNTKYQI